MPRFESALIAAAGHHDQGKPLPAKLRIILTTEASPDATLPLGFSAAGFFGDDALGAARFLIDAHNRRVALADELLRWARVEQRPDRDEQQRLAAKILAQHGEVPSALIAALSLGTSARWSNVAEAFARKWNPPKKTNGPTQRPDPVEDERPSRLIFREGTPVVDCTGIKP